MGETGAFMLSEPEAVVTLNEAFAGFKDHFDGHRTSTDLKMIENLRNTHPDFYVTCTNSKKMDLFGYAAAGHAAVKLDCDESTMDATRSYHVSSRDDTSPDNAWFLWAQNGKSQPVSKKAAASGKLKNHIRFGRWRYYWKSHEYLLYEMEYLDKMKGHVKLYFVLSPRSQFSAQEGKDSATDQLLLAVGAWSTQLHDEIYCFDDGYWRKSRELWESVQGSSWDEVILDPTMKDNLIKDIEGFFENQGLYKKFAVPWKRGVILHGVPGNGKTISIKALINTLNNRPEPIPSLYVKSFESCKGEQVSIHSIFDHARKMAPCLLIFEDLDSLVTEETRSYFLNEVDGLESNDGILMIGSTNHLRRLDPAISKRPSRFDRKYHFNLPGEAERAAYCRFWRNKLADTNMVDFPDEVCDLIAKMTEGFSFAYMKELFVIVLLMIARGGTGDEPEEVLEESASANLSEDGHVVVEHEDANVEESATSEPGSTESKAEKKPADEGKEEKPAVIPKIKRTVPEVLIRESLRDNVLLKVTKVQIKMLLDEMDNSDESPTPSEKKVDMGIARHPRRRTKAC